jgi:hypothetical protein
VDDLTHLKFPLCLALPLPPRLPIAARFCKRATIVSKLHVRVKSEVPVSHAPPRAKPKPPWGHRPWAAKRTRLAVLRAGLLLILAALVIWVAGALSGAEDTCAGRVVVGLVGGVFLVAGVGLLVASAP